MAKGVSIKFRSYQETIPKILSLIKFNDEIKKHTNIILKPSLRNLDDLSTKSDFVEAILKYCIENKNPDSKVFIAEGSDGEETEEVYEKKGYRNLAERYNVSLVDLNNTEVEEVIDGRFLKFDKIFYPKVLLDSFIISLPRLAEDAELEILGSLSNMLGVFPSSYYKGLFSSKKNKIRKWPIKYSIHDILRCKTPEFAVIDASEQGLILAGVPLEMDKQAAKILGKEWKSIQHLRLVSESFLEEPIKAVNAEEKPAVQ